VEAGLERPLRLHDLRLDTAAEALAAAGAASVADLGCGDGKLLARLVRDRRFTKLIGLDLSARSLQAAAGRLKLGQANGPAEGRVALLHGALTYRDERWRGVDAAVLAEVVEHLDADRLPALAAVVFGAARPRTVVVTTPNAEYNALFPTLPAGAFRHPDHRFEWTRAELRAWAAGVEERYGYRAAHSGIGDAHPDLGAPTQMAVFTR
jgi:3' terminal RNA ribose 2'-O-methyltransferase Hen1